MSRKRLEREPMEEMGIHSSMTAENAQKRNRERKIVRRVCSALSVMVAAFMFYYLMKPAITMETHPGDGNPQLICGLEEHVHTEACWGYDHEAYEPVYVNSLSLNCTFLPHVHDENCYDMDGNLICGISEEYRHVHDMYCYDHGTLVCTLEEHTAEDDMEEIPVLVCGQEESIGHVHTDACYTTMWFTDEEPICGLQEGGPHIHTDECYGPVLICEEDHEHTDACFVEGLICGLAEGEGHVHALECYPSMKELTCGQEETVGHTHTEACYAMQLVEKEVHVHSEACYTDGVLTCGEMEIRTHQHTPECWQETQVLVNGGHVHNEECVKVLVCGQEEHVHGVECYSGDPEAVKALVQGNSGEEQEISAAENNGESSGAAAEEELTEDGADDSEILSEGASEQAANTETGNQALTAEGVTGSEAQADAQTLVSEEGELVEEASEDLSFASEEFELVDEDVEWEAETILMEEQQTEPEGETASGESEQVFQDESVKTDEPTETEADETETVIPPVEENTEEAASAQDEQAAGGGAQSEEHTDGTAPETAGNPEDQEEAVSGEQDQFASIDFVTDIANTEDGQFSVQLHTDEGVRVQDILKLAGVEADQVSISSDIAFLEIGEDYFACRFAFEEGRVILTAGETEITVLCTFVSGQAAEPETQGTDADGENLAADDSEGTDASADGSTVAEENSSSDNSDDAGTDAEGSDKDQGEGAAEMADARNDGTENDADGEDVPAENADAASEEVQDGEAQDVPLITVLLNGEATEQVRAELDTEKAQALQELVQGYLKVEQDETADETTEEPAEVTEAQILRVFRVSSEEAFEGHAEIGVQMNETFADVIPEHADLTSVNYRMFRVDAENGEVISVNDFTVDDDAEAVRSFTLGTDQTGTYAFVCTVSYTYREYQAEIELDLSDFMVVPEDLSGDSGISVITVSAAENVPEQGSAMRRQTMSKLMKMSTAPAAESSGIAIDMQKLMDQLAAQGIDTENEFAGIRLSMNADEGADMDFSGMSEESSDGNVFFDSQSLKILDNGTVVLKGKHITVTVRVVGFHKAGETSTYEFTFGENKSVYMSEIFASVGMPENFVPARFSYTLSDDSLVSLVREENDCLVTANDYFDEVTLNIERGWYRGIILLRNMKPETEEKTEMWSEDGTVSIMLKDAVALPEGTKPVAVPSEGVDIQEYLAADFGENADVQLKWFDISLGDVHEISATVMLPGVIELPDNSENRVMHVDARVYHVREDGIHTLDATVNGSDITFETDGFSEFGIAWVVTFENEETGETYTLTLPGARDIPLDEILEGIALNADPAGDAEAENETAQNDDKRVEKVESSEEEIVRVLQTEEGWAVRILKEGKAHLIITMNDETVITIHVVSQGITKKTSDDETVEISTVNSLYLPEDAYVKAEQLDDVSAQTAIETVKANTAVAESGEETGRTVYKVFDISLENVNTDEYDGFQVAVKLPEQIVGRDFRLFHIHEGIMEEIGLETIAGADDMYGQTAVAGIAFETSGFSQFVVRYTVDFEYSVNGNTYDFSLPGGGFMPLRQLVEVLCINEDANETDIDQFIADIENVEISDANLVWTGKAEEDTTVGQLKLAYGLECEYSTDLTEEQIEEINGATVPAGEWILISVKPFMSEETLTVTMKDGEKFVVEVTDAQDSQIMIGKTTADDVVIRENHYSLSAKVTTIPEKGTRVSVLSTAEGILGGLFSHWYQIEYTDEDGTVYTGYVEQNKIEIVEIVELEPVSYDTFTATLSFEAGMLPEGTALAVNTVSFDDETVERYRTLIETQLITGDENKGIRGEIMAIDFFDLSVLADDIEVQPSGEVRVSLALNTPVVLNAEETLRVIHFASEDTATVLPNDKVELTTDENDAITDVSFLTDGFSAYALARVIEKDYIARDGNLYHVTVTYGADAKLPVDATLNISEFDEDSDEYAYARNSVLADKKARGEWVDLSSFELAALDISILSPDGEEIEPEAPVQVDIRIKELPGVKDLSEIANTLAIQHHVEVEDGVVVETVFDGNAEASFELKTNEAVVEEGIIVDPESVSEEDFADPVKFMPYSGEGAEEHIYVSFQTPVFSTFTVTWGTPASEDYRMNLDGKSFVLVNESHSAALVAENINDNTRLKAVQFSPSDDSITKWHFQRINNNNWYYYITDGNGHYLNIGDGNNSYVRVSTEPQQIYIDRNNNNLFRLQRSNGSNSTAVNLYGGNISGGFGPYNDRGENEWFRAYYPLSGDMATIHYVDEAGNELTVSNGQPVNDTTTMTYYYWDNGWKPLEYPYNYLIYDVDGYEYAYTYRNSNTSTNRITPILTYRDNHWKYTSGKDTTGANNTWNDLSKNDDIYVVYKKKASVSNGGTPVPKITGEKPDVPTITKGSVVNGDGTNTLSLSVTGHTSIMEAEKLADVIVVYDVSGSMNYRMDSETDAAAGERRMDYAQTATKALATALLGKNTTDHPDLIRMALISFSNTAEKKQDFTTDLTTFNNTVTNLPSPDGGTNWEYALQLANEMAVESDRATFVMFVTDGNPTFRQTRGVLNNSGTGSLGDNDVTDYYFAYNVYGVGSSDKHGRNYAAALTQAQSIVSHNKIFYTIGISNDVTNLTKLTTEAGAGADHSKTTSDGNELVQLFNDIAASIIGQLGYSDVQISDGITDLSHTVAKMHLVGFDADDLQYYKTYAATQADVTAGRATAVGQMITVSWDPASENCEPASYDEDEGAVVWNMGTRFMPQDGMTYEVRFKVWPSQQALRSDR